MINNIFAKWQHYTSMKLILCDWKLNVLVLLSFLTHSFLTHTIYIYVIYIINKICENVKMKCSHVIDKGCTLMKPVTKFPTTDNIMVLLLKVWPSEWFNTTIPFVFIKHNIFIFKVEKETLFCLLYKDCCPQTHSTITLCCVTDIHGSEPLK